RGRRKFLHLKKHVDHPVLQRLKRTNRNAELLTVSSIRDSVIKHDLSRSRSLRTKRGDRTIYSFLQSTGNRASFCKQGVSRDFQIVEDQVSGWCLIDQTKRFDRATYILLPNRKQSKLAVSKAHRNQYDIGISGKIYCQFFAVQFPAVFDLPCPTLNVFDIPARLFFFDGSDNQRILFRNQTDEILFAQIIEQGSRKNERVDIRSNRERSTQCTRHDHFSLRPAAISFDIFAKPCCCNSQLVVHLLPECKKAVFCALFHARFKRQSLLKKAFQRLG